jgi:hypothetical protein
MFCLVVADTRDDLVCYKTQLSDKVLVLGLLARLAYWLVVSFLNFELVVHVLVDCLLVLSLGPSKTVCNKVHSKAAVQISVRRENCWFAVK